MTREQIKANLEVCERAKAQPDVPVCGSCSLPIHPGESGLRYSGFHTSHSHSRCVELLKLELALTRDSLTGYEAVLRENLRLREALEKLITSSRTIHNLGKPHYYGGEMDSVLVPIKIMSENWEELKLADTALSAPAQEKEPGE